MLELYDNGNSVCAQKVRVALAEKGLEWKRHGMTLRGDQFDPAYMKLNPNAVVPTLVHDGRVITESSVILFYLDETFLVNKLIDEYVHNACVILTFGTAFRPRFAGMSGEDIEKSLARSPLRKRTEYKRDVALHGLESKYAREALESHEKLLNVIDKAGGGWLAGSDFSLADIAAVPYILRLELLKMSRLWEHRPGVAAWYKRVLARPSVRREILERMTPEDHAPFEALEDPWRQVAAILS
jgi:glutathione S-transferase